MGSRVRLDPDRIYEVFLELGKPIESSEEPYVLQIFPETYTDPGVLKSVPKFAFPCLSDDSIQPGEHFTFVLTDIESRFKFCFCRVSLQTHTCLCVISWLPWYEVFYQLLDSVSDLLSSNLSVTPFLNALYLTESFKPGEDVTVTVPDSNQHFRFSCPTSTQLPLLPDNKNLLELCTCFDVNNMMVIFASLLWERRILAFSQSLSRLTACIAGASLLLCPMNWQHLYIPVLPPHLLDYCSAPMPYLIGLHSSVMKKVKVQELGDTVILDVDENAVKSEYDDLSMLPEDVVSGLKRRLKQQDKLHGNQPTPDGVARAFLKTMVAIIGGYRDALRFRPGELITFDPDAFAVSRPTDVQPLLLKVLQLQTFQQFISDRLDLLNAGEGFKDEFDVESSLYSDKWGTQSRYKDWLNHMKKQGKKLRRDGKDRWLEITSKVRDRSRKTWKDLASTVEDVKKDETGSSVLSLNTKSLNIYSEPHRPPRPPPNLSRALGPVPLPRQSTIRRQSLEKVQRYHPILDETGSSESGQFKMERLSIGDPDLTFNPLRRVNTDLMTDPDIQTAFRKSYSLEDFNPGPCDVDFDDEEAATGDVAVTVTWDQLSVPDCDKWTPADSEVSLNSKSSGSTTGSDFISSGRGFSGTRPVPSQRQSAGAVGAGPTRWPAADASLITLDTRSSGSVDFLENIEFDPLKQPVIKDQPSPGSEGPGKIPPPARKPRHERVSKQPGTSPSSSPKPGVGWNSSPAPVRGVVVPSSAQSMREARAAFIQADVVKPVISMMRQESLDQFDPLASGQLVVDMPFDLSSRRSMVEDENNLLKEWNLDFDKSKQDAIRGGAGLNIPAPATAFSSMPSLFPFSYPSPGYHNSQVNRQYMVGPSSDRRIPVMISPMQPVAPVNLPPLHQPHANVLHPAPNALCPSAPRTFAVNNGFSARSATLPTNSGLPPGGICGRNTIEVARVPPASSVLPSDHSTFDPLEGFDGQDFDPLLQTKHQKLDFVPQNNNQWEKFE